MPNHRGDPQVYLDSERARLEAKLKKQEVKILRLAGEIAEAIPSIPCQVIAERVRNIVGSVEMRYSFGGPLETAAEAREKLEEVADAAERLRTAIRILGPGALEVVNQRFDSGQASPEDLRLRREAGVHEIGAGLWPMDLTDECIDIWKRGGIWCIRLQALADLARLRSNHIKKTILGGRHHGLTEKIRGSQQEQLFNQCAKCLADWLTAPETQRLNPRAELFFDIQMFRRLLLKMGQNIHEMIQEEPLSVKQQETRKTKKTQKSQWGRAAAKKAEAWLFGTSPKIGPLKDNR